MRRGKECKMSKVDPPRTRVFQDRSPACEYGYPSVSRTILDNLQELDGKVGTKILPAMEDVEYPLSEEWTISRLSSYDCWTTTIPRKGCLYLRRWIECTGERGNNTCSTLRCDRKFKFKRWMNCCCGLSHKTRLTPDLEWIQSVEMYSARGGGHNLPIGEVKLEIIGFTPRFILIVLWEAPVNLCTCGFIGSGISAASLSSSC